MPGEVLFLGIVPIMVTLSVVLLAAWIDVRTYRIPNWLTAPFLISGLAYAVVQGGWVGLQASLLGAGVGFGILFLLYCLGAMGGGDVKLLAGIGAWLGALPAALVFVVAAAVNVCYSLVLLAWRGELRRAVAAVQIAVRQMLAIGRHLGNGDALETKVEDPATRRRLVPFGLMLAFGVVLVAIVIWRLPS